MNHSKLITAAVRRRLDERFLERALPQSTYGQFVENDGEVFYCIHNVHNMNGFFMSLSGPGDHWMFVSSQGAVTAGRQCPLGAFFPYYCADKLTDMQHCTGPRTIIRVPGEKGRNVNWEPFATGSIDPSIVRHLYKNASGSKLIFEEVNHALELVFQYQWTFSCRFGFVRSCELNSFSNRARTLSVLDGFENILPASVDDQFQMRFSNLADAYKKNELLRRSNLGVYFLNSIPTDRAEPSEGLRANVAWHYGVEAESVLLSSDQVSRFCETGIVSQESELRGKRGAYLVHHLVELDCGQSSNWGIVGDAGLDTTDVHNLNYLLDDTTDFGSLVEANVENSERKFAAILASADGFQVGANQHATARHTANVLYNVMRGGIPADGYWIQPAHFRQHVERLNRSVAQRHAGCFSSVESGRPVKASQSHRILLADMLQRVNASGDLDLIRIANEYLPLTFSRRHGDPTRPWNRFSIKAFSENGDYTIDYQGNWRDIFQNWEALLLSYPKFAPGMVFRFLNASTADGHNPYRLTMTGFQWESPDPDDPWSNIGYWGDHQIVYLQKLLEWTRKFCPESLNHWLNRKVFVFAEIPYRIRSYREILKNANETIDYDVELEKQIQDRVDQLGSDGKLLPGPDGTPYRVTMAEKLLLPALIKLTNLIPGGGIWLNTQRPEWNDANNALVGNGLSVVTVCHLRRFFEFLSQWFGAADCQEFEISDRVAHLLYRIRDVFNEHFDVLDNLTEQQRKVIVDALSWAGSDYRCELYAKGFSGKFEKVSVQSCVEFTTRCVKVLDQTIQQNRRSDGLYHSYNLLVSDESGLSIEPLFEMLEGQVAVLSSGLLSPAEALSVLTSLRNSAMFRKDQSSYMLYPDRDTQRFTEKNRIEDDRLQDSPLAQQLLESQHKILRKDSRDNLHFGGSIRNAEDLNAQLDALAEDPDFTGLVDSDRSILCDAFESTFNHRRFIGRSTSFFGYEGLGSIYWHMVSKLCLAAQECLVNAMAASADPTVVAGLRSCYRDIRDGIAKKKTPLVYGAFPSDPYSHTPAGGGAQQPGMTGQVKEDILIRFCELGVRVENGCLAIDPALFEIEEFLTESRSFAYIGLDGEENSIKLFEGAFAFTFCKVPFVLHRNTDVAVPPQGKLRISYRDHVAEHVGLALNREQSESLFGRCGDVIRIDCFLPEKRLRDQS